jgi:hypothetical protein
MLCVSRCLGCNMAGKIRDERLEAGELGLRGIRPCSPPCAATPRWSPWCQLAAQNVIALEV